MNKNQNDLEKKQKNYYDRVSQNQRRNILNKMRFKQLNEQLKKNLQFNLSYIEHISDKKLQNLILSWLSQNPSIQQKISYFEDLKSSDAKRQHHGIIFIRKMFEEEQVTIQEILDQNLLVVLLDILRGSSHYHLVFESLNIVNFIVANSSFQTNTLITRGLLEILLNHLGSQFEEIALKSLSVLLILSQEQSPLRNKILNHKISAILVNNFENTSDKAKKIILQIFVNVLQNGQQNTREPQIYYQIFQIIVEEFIRSEQPEFLQDAILTFEKCYDIQASQYFQKANFFQKMKFMYQHYMGDIQQNMQIVSQLTYLIGNLTSGDNGTMLDLIFASNILDLLVKLLDTQDLKLCSLVIWTFSNIVLGEQEHVQSFIQNYQCIEKIAQMIQSADQGNIQYQSLLEEIVYFFCNLCTNNLNIVQFVMQKGILNYFLHFLQEKNENIILVTLEGITHLCRIFKSQDQTEQFAQILIKIGIADQLENLLLHETASIYFRSLCILDTYFELENDNVFEN